jgi:hypothetical protein
VPASGNRSAIAARREARHLDVLHAVDLVPVLGNVARGREEKQVRLAAVPRVGIGAKPLFRRVRLGFESVRRLPDVVAFIVTEAP